MFSVILGLQVSFITYLELIYLDITEVCFRTNRGIIIIWRYWMWGKGKSPYPRETEEYKENVLVILWEAKEYNIHYI